MCMLFEYLCCSTRVESLILSIQISAVDPLIRTSLGNETVTISFNIEMVRVYFRHVEIVITHFKF